MKRKLTILSVILMLLLASCVQIPAQETQVPAEPELLPTNTPMYLSPLYKTYMFVGGGGWASNLEQNKLYYTRNFGEHWLNVTPDGFDSADNAGSVFFAFPNSSLGWICQSKIESPGLLYATNDSGLTWMTQQLDFPVAIWLLSTRRKA